MQNDEEIEVFGQSQAYDFLACAGLGVASASTLIATFELLNLSSRKSLSALFKNVVSALVGMVMLGAQYALAIFIGESRFSRLEGTTLGYALGAILVGLAFLLLKRKT